MMLYGRNRIGKTTFAAQFPKPLALLAIEPAKTGGAKSITGVPGVMARVLRRTADLHEFAVAFSQPGHGYKTVVIDSASSLEKIVLQEIKGWDAPIEQLRVGNSSGVSTDDYTERAERMKNLIRPFLNLEGVNVVILANEKDHNSPESDKRKSALARQMMGLYEGSYYGSDTGAGTARWLNDSCDYIVQMFEDNEVKVEFVEVIAGQPKQKVETPTGKRVRRLRLGTHPNFAAGARVDQYSRGKELPEFIDGKNPAELYKNFREAIK